MVCKQCERLDFLMLFSSVTQSCPTLCNPMDCSTPGFPVHQQLPELAQTHVHWAVMPSNHFILCHPLLLLPLNFPSIRVFSNELVHCIRWSKDWSFSFSFSLPNECSGFILHPTNRYHPHYWVTSSGKGEGVLQMWLRCLVSLSWGWVKGRLLRVGLA